MLINESKKIINLLRISLAIISGTCTCMAQSNAYNKSGKKSMTNSGIFYIDYTGSYVLNFVAKNLVL